MLSTQVRNEIVEHVTRSALFVSAHTGDPGETGAHEVAGGGYGRRAVGALSEVREGFRSSTAAVLIHEMPKCRVTHVGIWDAEKGGALRHWSALVKPIDLYEGETLRFKPGQIGFAIGEKK